MMNSPIGEKINALTNLKQDCEKCRPGKDSVLARMAHRLGDFSRTNGDFEKGIALTTEAIKINKQHQPGAQRSYLTHSYYNLALYHNLLGLTEEAHLYYDSCAAIGYHFPEKMFIVLMALEKKAYLYFQTGDYQQSISVADEGLVLARNHTLPEYEALLLVQRAQSEAEINRMDQAGKDISLAIQLLNSNDLQEYLPNAYSVYANVLSRRRQFDQAIDYYGKAVESNLELNNIEQAARDLHDLGFLYDRELKDSQKSISYYNKALEVLRTMKDPYMLSATYNNLGQVCWRKNDFQQALVYYQEGLMALPIHFSRSDARQNPNTSQLRDVTNDYVAAALLWNKGDAWLGMYKQEHDTVFLELAIASYRCGDRMVDQMRWKQHGDQSKLFWREKTKRWYAKAIETAFLLDDADEVFYFMEKSRAVLLNDKLAEIGAKNQLPEKEADTERALRVKLQSMLTLSSREDAASIDDIWQAQRNLNSFIRNLEKRYPSYYSYKYDTAVSSIADVRKNLISGSQAWIEFFTNQDTLYALAITSGNTILRKLYFKDHFRIARRITDLCSSRSSINSSFKQYHELAYLYYEAVFRPLNITESRITISHDEYFLPFDLLQTDPVDQTSFLVRRHAFSYAYSASQLLKRKPKTSSSGESLLAIAPVHYESHLRMQELRGAGQSLEKIGSSYDGGVLLTGSAATKRTFLKQIPGFSIIHLYSHAKADSLGEEPVIYFYDSALNLSELQNLTDLKTQLIVLFACNSGVGKTVKGEGIFSLARGFAAAGIPSTVSALWEIDNKATYTLAEIFFEKLAQGEPGDLALQSAKLAMINNYDREYELPYYWAGAVLIGKVERYRPGGNSFFSRPILWGFGIVFLACLVFLLARRRNLVMYRKEKVPGRSQEQPIR